MAVPAEVPIPREEKVEEFDPADCLTPEGNRTPTLADCETLIKSIEANGQYVPGIVCRHPTLPGKNLVPDGNRRAFSCLVLGKKFRAVLVDSLPTKGSIIKVRLTTNCIREAMNRFDVARDVTDFMQEHGITTQTEAAERLNLKMSTLNRALGTKRIPDWLRPLAEQVLPSAYLISTLPVERMEEALKLAIGPPALSRDRVAKLVAEMKGKRVKKAKAMKIVSRGGIIVTFPADMDDTKFAGELNAVVEADKRRQKNRLPLSSLPAFLQ